MKRLRIIFTIWIAFVCVITAPSQTTFEEMSADLNKTGGVYYAYPSTQADNTPAPKGYKPFHISHYGRHGSRYLISDRDYEVIRNLLHNADQENALTPIGKEILQRVDSLMIETAGRGGDLSPLGRRQHHDIAARMYENYPDVFSNNSEISARSTLVPRVILSMASFCESLKEKNPRLSIDMESSERYMPYLCRDTKESYEFYKNGNWWSEVLHKMRERNTNPDRMVNAVFSDPVFVKRYVKPYDFMWSMYWLASDAQNTEGKIDFYKYFEPRELFDLWQCFNADFYGKHGPYPLANGVHLTNSYNLMHNVIDTAEAAIKSENPSAALRFGHDGNVVPFAALLGLDNCTGEEIDEDKFYQKWCDWKVAPMGANIQLIFFRNDKKPNDVLVKFLHNEKETHIPVHTDIWPYYRWNDVKSYYEQIMQK